MANRDVIHYDSQCLESLQQDLNKIRKELLSQATVLRLLNLVRSGADIHTCKINSINLRTTGARVSSGLTPLVVHRIASAMGDLGEHVESLQKRLKQVSELFEACETRLCAYSLPEPDQAPTTPNDAATREENLDVILTMLRNVPKPHELSSVLLGKYLFDSKPVQENLSNLALATGKFTQMDSIPTDLYNHTMYSYSSFFDGYVPADFKPLTMESLMLLVPGDPSYDDVVNIIKLLGIASESKVLGPVSSILGAMGGITEDMLNTINQARLLQSMDRESALERAKLYQESYDPSMIAVGYVMEQLLTADPAKQVEILSGTAKLSAVDDITNCVAEIALPIAITAATGCTGAPVVAAVQTTLDVATTVGDLALNTSSIPTVINNTTYAADMVYETYGLYDKAYKAYKADPSEANLKKAVIAYETYQHAIADSYSALDATVNTVTDSNVGKGLKLNEIEAFDKAAKASENHRQLANTMNYTYDQYSGK